ncbi:MAG TPA: methyltransferase domain-containing protein [Roseiflexaceae bacterium]|nr:methyltransferase domain-containing protein [Roseiflexaceae bacterium]
MYSDHIPFLRCLGCGGALDAEPAEVGPGGELVRGALRCGGCGVAYPVRAGVADFLGQARPETPAQRVNEWPLTAWGYERLWRPFALSLLSGEPFPLRRELPLVLGLAGARRGGLFVDVACSNGLYARALARVAGPRGAVIGVDHSFAMLAEARRRALAAGLRISYLRAEAQGLPVASGAAAGVLIGGSLNEIGDLPRCLAEARRTLAPDGRFVTMCLARARTPAGRLAQRALGSGGITFWTAEELAAQYARAGLRVAGLWRYGVVLFLLSVLPSQQKSLIPEVFCG